MPDTNHPEPDGEFVYDSKGSPAKRWMITVNRWDYDMWMHMMETITDKTKVDYWIWCDETAPTTGKMHRHMYIVCSRKLRRNQVSEWFGDMHPHITNCDGPHEKSKAYITKCGDFHACE